MEKQRLHLVLKKQWYDLIDSGIKKEEYREIKNYWNARFIDGQIKIGGKLFKPSEIYITFQLGYTNVHRIHFECTGLEITKGKLEWGAEKNNTYHVLKLGKRIWK
tara:strand:- start:2027 stop:2341 length:315 start_codon:yes stop_codon:yes gene_type:complete